MREQLAGAQDPVELVPGDPAAVFAMAGSLGGIGVVFEDIGLGFRDIDDGGWRGAAADAFRGFFERQPKRFLSAADAFVSAAVALDTYASALSWAQRQAAEAMALVREPPAADGKGASSLTLKAQAEENGLLVGGDAVAAPRETREVRYLAAVDTLSRARGQLEQVGHEAAVKLRVAGEAAPREMPLLAAVMPAAPAEEVARRGLSLRSRISPDVVPASVAAVRQHPDFLLKQRLDFETLRDNPAAWEAGAAKLRERLRRLALDQLSPRLSQHLFEGHFKKRKKGIGYRELGYHHREGGVDREAVRVVRVVAEPDVDGVYRARVAGPKTEGGAEMRTNTFFPDSWSRHDVLRAILIAFLNRTYFDDREPSVSRRWRGCARGLLIEGYVETQVIEPAVSARSARPYHVVTAYPIYRGGDDRGQGD